MLSCYIVISAISRILRSSNSCKANTQRPNSFLLKLSQPINKMAYPNVYLALLDSTVDFSSKFITLGYKKFVFCVLVQCFVKPQRIRQACWSIRHVVLSSVSAFGSLKHFIRIRIATNTISAWANSPPKRIRYHSGGQMLSYNFGTCEPQSLFWCVIATSKVSPC